MALNKTIKKLNLENEVEEVVIEEPATIEDVVDRDITNSEFQETSKDLEDAIETSDELESVGSEVQEELDAVNDRLESEEPIDPVDVTVVNESIQHYSKLLGLTRESVNLSLEDVRNNTRESMEGLKVELEGIGEKIKEFGKKVWAKILELFGKLLNFIKKIFPGRKAKTMKTLATVKEAIKESEEAKEKYDYRVQRIIDQLQSKDLINAAKDNNVSPSDVANIAFLTLFKMFGTRLEKLPAYLDGIKLFILENKKAVEKRNPELNNIEIGSLRDVNNNIIKSIDFIYDRTAVKGEYLDNIILTVPRRKNKITLLTRLVKTETHATADNNSDVNATLATFNARLELDPIKIDDSFFKIDNLISLYKTFYSKIDAVKDAIEAYKNVIDKLAENSDREEYDIAVFKHNSRIVYNVASDILIDLEIIMEDFVDDFKIAAVASKTAINMANKINETTGK